MDDQEAQSIIDSQPGTNLLEKEANAVRQLNNEEDLATTSFYSTLTRLTEHYSDSVRWEGTALTMDDYIFATQNFADISEQNEADHMLDTTAFHMELTQARSQALARYIQQQQMAVQA